jgi:phosphatidylinositol glycan class B
MISIIALALAVRLIAIFLFPSLHHPDENYQTLEQAHRLVFGYGVKTWEFEDGIRSLVIPYLLAGVFWLTDSVLRGPQGTSTRRRYCLQ